MKNASISLHHVTDVTIKKTRIYEPAGPIRPNYRVTDIVIGDSDGSEFRIILFSDNKGFAFTKEAGFDRYEVD